MSRDAAADRQPASAARGRDPGPVPPARRAGTGRPWRPADRPTLGTFVWVGIISLVPLERLISFHFGPVPAQGVLVAIAACLVLGRVRRPVLAPLWPAAGLVTVAASVLTGQGVLPSTSIVAGLRLGAVIGLLPFVLAFFVARDRSFVRLALGGFVVVQSLSALAAMAQWGGTTVLGVSARGGRVSGLCVHPNILGLMSALVLVVAVDRALTGGRKERALAAGLLPLHGAAIVLSGSLSGASAALAGLATIVLVRRAYVAALGAAVLGAACAAPFIIAGVFNIDPVRDRFVDRIQSVAGVGAESTRTLLTRQLTYDYAIAYLRESPVVGRGFDDVNAGTYNGITVVHNFLLRSWFQGGILFVAVALAVHVAALVVVVAAIRRRTDAIQAATIVAILVYAMSAAFMAQYQYWIPLLLAFVCVGVAPESNRRSGEVARPRELREPGDAASARRQGGDGDV